MVVVVGGDVVVVGAEVVGVAESDEGVVVIGTEVVGGELLDVDLGDVEVVLTSEGLVAAELAPGCSLATTTPITKVAPVAARPTERVSRRKRAVARWRVSGEWLYSGKVTGDGEGFGST